MYNFKRIYGNTFQNTASSRFFSCYRCDGCPHRKRGEYSYSTCGATFTAIDDDCDIFVNDDSDARAYIVYDNDEYGDGDAVIMCGRAARYLGARCADGDEYAYYNDYVFNGSRGDYYTRAYAYDHELQECPDCGDWYEDCDWNEPRGMCNECAGAYSIIGDWHDHKGDFVPVGDSRDDCRIGTELEVDGGDDENDEMAYDIDSAFPNHFVFENDCSLDTGFEIISQPHTLDAFKALDWERLCDMLIRNHYISHDAGTCGLHVHFSAAWFGETLDEQRETLARVLRWYEDNFDTMVKLSRRGDNYHGYAERNSRAHYWSGTDYSYGVDIDDAVELVEHSVCGSRYVAVNCCNFYRYGTVEFRLARGTLRAATLRAWIDLHVGIIRACCYHSAPTLETVLTYCTDAATAAHVREKLAD